MPPHLLFKAFAPGFAITNGKEIPILFIENAPALHNIARVKGIKNYMDGQHLVLSRKDFTFKNETFKTAKIILQSIKPIIDFHTSYICGNPITISGDTGEVSAINAVYKKGAYNKLNYDIANNIYTYGNAYEYVYRDESGTIRSKLINVEDGYPIYNQYGEYVSFIEYWNDVVTNEEHSIVYTPSEVTEFNGNTPVASYNNATGLPIHYTSGNIDRSGFFGIALTSDLIPIMNEIEALLSKMTDSVNTLSLNPLGVSIGDRVDSSVDSDVTGAILNIESGGDFKWATATLDNAAITTILNNLFAQFYVIAQVPSILYGQSNVANVSEVSLELLFNGADNLSKKTAFSMIEGFNKRSEYIGKLMGMNLSDLNYSFNYNRPTDNSRLVDDIKKQIEMGIMSKETGMRISPYVVDVEEEKKMINKNAMENGDSTSSNA